MKEFVKKPVVIEICAVLIVFAALSLYCLPKFMHKQEVRMAAKIKADGAAFTAKALEEFAINKDAKPSEISQKIVDELNSAARNPYDKKAPAYTFEKNCKGCNSVEYDDALTMIMVTTYDKEGKLYARTVIKPPSFVTFTKPQTEQSR